MARAIAQFAYVAQQPGDLSFDPGDEITVLQQNADGWWQGRTADGRQGVFPFNRVVLQAAAPAPAQPPRANYTAVVAPVQNVIIDRIIDTIVTVEEPVPEFGAVFEVDFTLSTGTAVEGKKSMKEFRVLAAAVNNLLRQGDKIEGYDRAERVNATLPEWADNIKLPVDMATTKMKERAFILQDFLNNAKNNPKAAYMLVYWLNPGAAFSLPEPDKREAQEALRGGQVTIDNRRPGPNPVLARALYKWHNTEDQDNIRFVKNEIMAIQENSDFEGWWIGTKVNGDEGLFPFNYVEKLKEGEADELIHPDVVKQPSFNAPIGLPPPTMNLPKKKPQQPGIGMDLRNEFGVGSAADNMQYAQLPNTNTNVSKPVAAPAQKEPRARNKITKYALSCNEAFEQLLNDGLTIEENGKLAKFGGMRDTPKPGDKVTLFYNGYLWEPQKQELLEFASSDVLISNGNPNNKAGPLEFVVGNDQAIDGIEEAVMKMHVSQTVRVTLTPEKAYQDVGFPPDIPGNAFLVYDLTLSSVQRGAGGGGGGNLQGVGRSKVAARPTQRQADNRGYAGGRSMRQFQSEAHTSVPTGVDPEHFKKQLTLAKLQEIVAYKRFHEYGIQPGLIEEYLTDAEFQRAFKMSHAQWLLLQHHRRVQLRKEAGLF